MRYCCPHLAFNLGCPPVGSPLKPAMITQLGICKQVQPNSLNIFKFPLIAMFWNMIFYMRCS